MIKTSFNRVALMTAAILACTNIASAQTTDSPLSEGLAEPATICAGFDATMASKVVAQYKGISVTYCDLYYYLAKTTREDTRLRALGRPGAIHNAIENIVLVRSLAAEELNTTDRDRDELEWLARDFINRELMDGALAKRKQARLSDVDVDALAKEFYLANPDKFILPSKVDVSHILIKAEGRGYVAALAEIQEIRGMLDEGADFLELAEQFSEDESVAVNRGHIGEVKRGQTFPTFEDAAYGLSEEGEISEPVFTIFGIHLIRLEKIIPERHRPYREVARQLRKKIEDEETRGVKTKIFEDLRLEMALELNEKEPEIFQSLVDAYGLVLPEENTDPPVINKSETPLDEKRS